MVGPDPRRGLAVDTNLITDDRAAINDLLDRLDARTPWARTTLARIGREPGITTSELAAGLPLGKESLKRRDRTLTEHGLIRSRHVGFELSERGHAYLAATNT